jgi:predicted transcriptional regulator
VGKEWAPADLFEVLASEAARRILVHCAGEPRSADELADHLDASLPTIYRRLNALEEYDLLQSETRIDPDGNHFRTFETSVDRVTVAISEEGIEPQVERDRDVVDRFGTFWDDLERLSREGDH